MDEEVLSIGNKLPFGIKIISIFGVLIGILLLIPIFQSNIKNLIFCNPNEIGGLYMPQEEWSGGFNPCNGDFTMGMILIMICLLGVALILSSVFLVIKKTWARSYSIILYILSLILSITFFVILKGFTSINLLPIFGSETVVNLLVFTSLAITLIALFSTVYLIFSKKVKDIFYANKVIAN